MKTILLAAASVAALSLAGSAAATTYVYVGSWNVADGPHWSGPDATGIAPSLSAVETAAYLFGGVASDYVTSTAGSSVGSIDFLAWVDGYADSSHLRLPYGSPGTPVADTFVGIVGPDYKSGSGNYSAYVFDHACGISYCDGGSGEISTNYAFRAVGVPEPAAWTLMLIGFAGLGAALRSRRRLVTAHV